VRKDSINEKRQELHFEINESTNNKKDVNYIWKKKTLLIKEIVNIEIKPIIQMNKIKRQSCFCL
jgi:hypothetical protein